MSCAQCASEAAGGTGGGGGEGGGGAAIPPGPNDDPTARLQASFQGTRENVEDAADVAGEALRMLVFTILVGVAVIFEVFRRS